ncbi:MAG: sensor domain-containing diguanylate cyclase [Sulfurovum sp.]|nr:sensor domain-containing diguanylate cyclase [Sulfurovum sp.]
MKIQKYLFTHTLKTIFMVLLMIIPTIMTANATLVLNDQDSTYQNFDVDYFIEPDGRFFDIGDIQEVNFTQSTSNKISLGFQDNEIWFRLKVENKSSTKKKMILEFTEVVHNVVDLYTFTASKELTYKRNGLNIPVNQREIQESTPSFKLYLEAGESKVLYLQLSSTHGIFGAIQLTDKTEYYQNIQMKKYLYLAYLVALMTIVLYNFLYFLYFKDRIYLYYITYVTLFGLWVANFKGLLLPFINAEIFIVLQLIIPLFFISLLLFSQSILETEKRHEKLHKIYNTIIYITLFSILWMSVAPESGFYLMNLLSTPLLITTLLSALWYLRGKGIINKLYIITLSVFTISMTILSLLTLGVIPYSHFLSTLIVVVSIIEIVLFSLLLAYRINLLRKESFESREKLIRQQKSESTRLFHTVGEKTKELNRAKEDLEAELKKKIELEKHLKHLASTDPMTELNNRRAFFELSELEISKAKFDKEQLSCLVIDIDHFKRINDTYGHDVGDIVINDVAKLMILNTRTKDHIGRIGGEEFAVLMPKTNAESAYQIADRLRENISKHTIAIDNHEAIKITISIGLSTLTKDKDETIHTLLKRADTALYKAKNNGRNQVCCLPEKISEEA